MRTRILLAVLLFVVAFSHRASCRQKTEQAHKATHTIYLHSMTNSVKCSATAIGPHALLTASHCEEPTDYISVDGEGAMIVGVPLRDGFDHSIFLVTSTLSDYAEIDSKDFELGDDVFIFGNPGNDTDIFRKGYVAGFKGGTDANPYEELFSGKVSVRMTLFDLNGFSGDSGSGVFDSNGKLRGVINVSYVQNSGHKEVNGVMDDGYNVKFMGSYGLHFTPEQLQRAKNFVPEKTVRALPISTGVFDQKEVPHD